MGSQQGDSTVNSRRHPLSKSQCLHLSLSRHCHSFFFNPFFCSCPLRCSPLSPCILSDWPAVSALINIASQGEENMKANGGWGPVTALRVKPQVSNQGHHLTTFTWVSTRRMRPQRVMHDKLFPVFLSKGSEPERNSIKIQITSWEVWCVPVSYCF